MFADEIPEVYQAIGMLHHIIDDAIGSEHWWVIDESHYREIALMLMSFCVDIPPLFLRTMVEDDELDGWEKIVREAFALDAFRESVRLIEESFRIV